MACTCTLIYIYIYILYVACTYMFMNTYICMYIIHTHEYMLIFMWTLHMHVGAASTTLHFPSGPISLATQASVNTVQEQLLFEQPPSWHQSFQLTDHPGVACHAQTAADTGSPHTNCCHAGHPLLQCHSCPQGSQTSCAGCTVEEQ